MFLEIGKRYGSQTHRSRSCSLLESNAQGDKLLLANLFILLKHECYYMNKCNAQNKEYVRSSVLEIQHENSKKDAVKQFKLEASEQDLYEVKDYEADLLDAIDSERKIIFSWNENLKVTFKFLNNS